MSCSDLLTYLKVAIIFVFLVEKKNLVNLLFSVCFSLRQREREILNFDLWVVILNCMGRACVYMAGIGIESAN